MEMQMFRIPRGVAAGVVAGAVLLAGGQALAQTPTTTTTKPTTTTTSTSTTTTTLQPHPFSEATGACVRAARKTVKDCHRGGTGVACRAPFETAYANCFKTGAGVTCAKRCITRESTCYGAAPATRKTCGKACSTTRRRDVRACRRIADGDNLWAGGDASCLATADANFHLCEFVCAQATADCNTNLKFCVANCPNL